MRRLVMLALAAAFLLTGCGNLPQSQETGSAAVVSVLGVAPADWGITVYAAAESREGEAPAVYQGQGATPAAAIQSLAGAGDQTVSCAHVEHVLLAQSGAGELEEVLSYAFRDQRQSTESQLWVVRSEDLSQVFSGTSDPARRMAVLKSAGKDKQGFQPVTLRQAAAALAEGAPLLIPALEQGEDGLALAGFALYDKGQFTAWLTGRSALGAALLMGDPIRWTGSVEDRAIALQSTGCQAEPLLTNGRLTGLSLRCHLEGVSAGGWISRESDVAQLEKEAAQAMKEALEILRQTEADGAGLKRRAGLQKPLAWSAISRQWEKAFPRLNVKISVRLTVTEQD